MNLPIMCHRAQGQTGLSLEQFVQEHDDHFYGENFADKMTNSRAGSLRQLHSLIDLQVINAFETVIELRQHLEKLDITNGERLRPTWDTYFMRLASLASLRSNCMKRRVGAILVRNKRILATGWESSRYVITEPDCWTGIMGHHADSSTAMKEAVCGVTPQMKYQTNVSACMPRKMPSSRLDANAWVTERYCIAIRE